MPQQHFNIPASAHYMKKPYILIIFNTVDDDVFARVKTPQARTQIIITASSNVRSGSSRFDLCDNYVRVANLHQDGAEMSRFLAAVTLTAAVVLIACMSHAARTGERTKQVTVDMKWERGGRWKGDIISLHFQKDSVDCSLSFSGPEQLEKYIENFGSAFIPVAFDVDFDRTGKPRGALLVRVGEWDASKLQPHERTLTTTQRFGHFKPGERKVIKIDSPGGCFDPIMPE